VFDTYKFLICVSVCLFIKFDWGNKPLIGGE
jgi:hypothetical protein